MNAAPAAKQWIQLRMADPGLAGVTVDPGDGDLFSLTRQVITRLGRVAHQFQEFETQLAALRRELEKWTAARADVIAEAFLVLKGDYFQFLVVMKGKAYDGALEDALTELDMAVAQNPGYDLIRLSVLAIPAFGEDVIRSFLPPYVDSKGASDDAEREEPPIAGQP